MTFFTLGLTYPRGNLHPMTTAPHCGRIPWTEITNTYQPHNPHLDSNCPPSPYSTPFPSSTAATPLPQSRAFQATLVCVAETVILVELSKCRNVPGNFTRQLRQNCKNTNRYRVSLGQKTDTCCIGLVLCRRPQIPGLDFHSCQVPMFLWPIMSSNRAAITGGVSDILVASRNLLSVFPSHLGACHCGLELHVRDEVALATFCRFSPT